VTIQLGAVQVQVQQIDALDLTAEVWRHDFWLPRLDVVVTNRSTHAGRVTLTVDAPKNGWLFTLGLCDQSGTHITCTFDLDQGQSAPLSVWVFRWWGMTTRCMCRPRSAPPTRTSTCP